MIVDRAVYRDGRRIAEPDEVAGMRPEWGDGAAVAWVALYRPTAEEFDAVASEFAIGDESAEHAMHPHQRPKLERYGDTLFCALRAARYIDDTETVEFDELHVFAGPGFLVTIRHGDAPDLPMLRRSLESRPDLVSRGPVGILYAIMDRVVEGYAPALAGVQQDIDEIEDEVFGGNADVSRRVYQLSREVIALQRATTPLVPMLDRLIGEVGAEDQRFLRDIQSHALRVVEQADAFRQLLQNILSVSLTLETKALNEASNAQSEEVKQISAWAAILFAPTLVASVYGMNFEHIPELGWRFGYAYALLLMAGMSVALYLLFRHRKWI